MAALSSSKTSTEYPIFQANEVLEKCPPLQLPQLHERVLAKAGPQTALELRLRSVAAVPVPLLQSPNETGVESLQARAMQAPWPVRVVYRPGAQQVLNPRDNVVKKLIKILISEFDQPRKGFKNGQGVRVVGSTLVPTAPASATGSVT
ncbi:uncharacterized protein LOC143181497 [Calliopsis andreniformis]|uniref:uncharacterized protein LOC143181497 n=1 Tax=Calliopsis andreniformis TaxID=337506 RepID=UPI003FCDDB11